MLRCSPLTVAAAAVAAAAATVLAQASHVFVLSNFRIQSEAAKRAEKIYMQNKVANGVWKGAKEVKGRDKERENMQIGKCLVEAAHTASKKKQN